MDISILIFLQNILNFTSSIVLVYVTCLCNFCITLCLQLVDCANGDVRLVDGMNAHEGRVEVCYFSSWGTVCHYGWSVSDATVVCRQLGYSIIGNFIIIVIIINVFVIYSRCWIISLCLFWIWYWYYCLFQCILYWKRVQTCRL